MDGKKSSLILFLLASVCSSVLAQKPTIGVGFGMFGLHGFIAPTVEAKFNNVNLRAKIGFNSVGLGLEFEAPMADDFGFFNSGGYDGYLLISLATNYQIRPPKLGFGLNQDLETIKPLSHFAFIGSKVYYNNHSAIAFKLGATAAEREWEYTDPFYGDVTRSQRHILPYFEFSVYGYPFAR